MSQKSPFRSHVNHTALKPLARKGQGLNPVGWRGHFLCNMVTTWRCTCTWTNFGFPQGGEEEEEMALSRQPTVCACLITWSKMGLFTAGLLQEKLGFHQQNHECNGHDNWWALTVCLHTISHLAISFAFPPSVLSPRGFQTLSTHYLTESSGAPAMR